MSAPAIKVVFDCNIFVQALISLNGPSGRCVEKAKAREVELFVSPYVLTEIREIHLKTPAKYGITAEQTEELATTVASFATIVADIPDSYQHPYDPDDSAYVNLALKSASEPDRES